MKKKPDWDFCEDTVYSASSEDFNTILDILRDDISERYPLFELNLVLIEKLLTE